MSQLVTASEVHTIVGGIRRQQVMDIVRGATFIAALLLGWVTLKPFSDLGDMQLSDLSTGNETLTYAAFGALAAIAIILAMRDNMPTLLTLLSPGYILFAGWIGVTVVFSLDPGTSIKRFALTICVVAVAASLMLLPKSQNELMRWFSVAVLALLAICYFGLLLAPNLSIHMATDAQEPALAGNWRGSFGHKNMAAAMMAMMLFFGVYVVRSGAWISGVVIVALASLFLLYAEGKSSLALCFAVLTLTSWDRDHVGRGLVGLPDLNAEMGNFCHRRRPWREDLGVEVEREALRQSCAGERTRNADERAGIALVRDGGDPRECGRQGRERLLRRGDGEPLARGRPNDVAILAETDLAGCRDIAAERLADRTGELGFSTTAHDKGRERHAVDRRHPDIRSEAAAWTRASGHALIARHGERSDTQLLLIRIDETGAQISQTISPPRTGS